MQRIERSPSKSDPHAPALTGAANGPAVLRSTFSPRRAPARPWRARPLRCCPCAQPPWRTQPDKTIGGRRRAQQAERGAVSRRAGRNRVHPPMAASLKQWLVRVRTWKRCPSASEHDARRDHGATRARQSSGRDSGGGQESTANSHTEAATTPQSSRALCQRVSCVLRLRLRALRAICNGVQCEQIFRRR